MDEVFPVEYTTHLKPILGLIGLSPEDPENYLINKSAYQSELLNTFLSITNKAVDQASLLTPWYEPNKDVNGFYMVRINKDHCLLKPRDVSAVQSNVSKLSPLNPESPLYPNTIMSNKWIHKQLTSAPSILLYFCILPPNQGNDGVRSEKIRSLIMELNDKKKMFAERGVKVGFILLTFNVLSFEEDYVDLIKKSCGLDSKSLFPFYFNTELKESDFLSFLSSCQKSLVENASNYYKEKVKKITKKKRIRSNQISATIANEKKSPVIPTDVGISTPAPTLGGFGLSPINAQSKKRVLNTQCWDIRYNFKLGVFSEFRQDFISALKYYEDAYHGIFEFMKSQLDRIIMDDLKVLQPFSNPWADAQILMDCISLKISKIYIYMNEYSAALRQFSKHLQYTHVLGSGSLQYPVEHSFYGINPWEWLSVQYRFFAEIIELAMTKGGRSVPFGRLKSDTLETPRVVPSLSSPHNSSTNLSKTIGYTLQHYSLPGLVIQKPGYYYHLAAKCYDARHQQLKDTLTTDEFKVSAMKVIELLTKAYEQNKSAKHVRNTLQLASEIAQIYKSTQDYQMALKFFEKIAKSYRKDAWYLILGEILLLCADCAVEASDWDVLFKCLIELLHQKFRMFHNRFGLIIDQIKEKLYQNSALASNLSVNIDANHLVAPIQCRIYTKLQSLHLDHIVPYQLHISIPELLVIHGLDTLSQTPGLIMTGIVIEFSDTSHNIFITHDKQAAVKSPCQRSAKYGFLDLGICQGNLLADLTFEQSETEKFISFCIKPTMSQDLVVSKVRLILATDLLNPCQVSLEYKIGEKSVGDKRNDVLKKWLEWKDEKIDFQTLDPAHDGITVRVLNGSLHLDMHFEPPKTFLLDELLPLKIKLSSTEELLYYIVDLHIEDDGKAAQNEFWSYESRNHQLVGAKVEGILNQLSMNNEKVLDLYHLKRLSGDGEFKLVITVYFSTTKFDRSMILTSPQIQKRIDMYKIRADKPFDLRVSGHFMANEMDSACQSMFCHIDLVWKGLNTIVTEDIKILSMENRLVHFNGKPQKGRIWKSKDSVSLTIHQNIDSSSTSVELGILEIQWKSVNSLFTSKTKLEIPALELKNDIVQVTINSPEQAYFGKPFTSEYTIKNTTKQIQELNLYVESSDKFVFSGLKSCTIKLLPLGEEKLYYTTYPIGCGKCVLPKLRLTKRKEYGSQAIASGNASSVENVQKDPIESYKISGLDASEISLFVYPVPYQPLE